MLRFVYEQLDARFIVSCEVCKHYKDCYANKKNYSSLTGFSCKQFKRRDPLELKIKIPSIDFKEAIRSTSLSIQQCKIDKDTYMRANWFQSGECLENMNTFTDICVFEEIIQAYQNFLLENKDELSHSENRLGKVLKTVIVVKEGTISYFCIDSRLDNIIIDIGTKNKYKLKDKEPEYLLQLQNGKLTGCISI